MLSKNARAKGKNQCKYAKYMDLIEKEKKTEKCRLTAEILLREIHRACYFPVLHTSVLPD